ncbi:MAG: TMEM175 family protein, partial [Limisphaerales bacterium]
MHKGRLEAFSDGVFAIIITIMVLELRAPVEAGFSALRPLLPVFLSYILSYLYIGIYWNNHHHMFQVTTHTNGRILWANLHLLFWISLFPFVTEWAGKNHYATWPTALYGVILFMAAVAYWVLQNTIIKHQGHDSVLAKAIGRDWKGKMSIVIYAVAVALAFVNVIFAQLLYLLVAL